jgi:parvulin-like peptidyl-prolyl isomerase
MTEILTISCHQILNQIKVSAQIPSLVEEILDRQIINRKAAEAGIEVRPEELQLLADSWRVTNQLESPEETMSWLQKHHLSIEEFGQIFQTTVVSSKLAEHLFADRVEPFLLEHQLDYARAVMYEIVLDDEDLALEFFCAISEGEVGFSELAYQYIQDKELSRCGGYRGAVSRKDLRPEISAAVFAANPPELLKPIVTNSGVHIIKVEEIIQPQLNDTLRQEIMATLFNSWLKQQTERLEIKIDLTVPKQAAQFSLSEAASF